MKTYVLSLAAGMLILASCKKLKELTHFNLTYNCETTIQSGAATMLPFDAFTPEITTQSESEFEGHKTTRHLIESVKLSEMTLTIISPEGRNFDFLNDLEIFISADGQEEMLIAEKHNIPDAVGSQLILEVRQDELKPYLTGEKYKLRLRVTTDKLINQDVGVRITSTFRVDANVLGL
jgi:hypothetical protein